MATKSTGDPSIDALYAVRKGRVDFVDVPELAFVVVDGGGSPGGEEFADAVQALYSVSYGAHFALRKKAGSAPRVMPLEALWWVEGAEAQAVIERVASGEESIDEIDRSLWKWRAMIMQLPPIDEDLVSEAVVAAKEKTALASLGSLRWERWAEGACAQVLHVGPYSDEEGSVVTLHRVIAEQGMRPRGRHHEIYLGDPRTAAPESLRTILRQPVEPAQPSPVS